MQVSKLSATVCAIILCAGLASVRAQDNRAQAAARAALLEKIGELDAADGHPPAIVVTPSGATVEKPALPDIQTPPPAPTLPVAPADNQAELKAQAKKDAQAKKAAALAEKKKADDEAAAQAKAKADAEKAAKLEKQNAALAEKKRATAEKAAMSSSPAKTAVTTLMPIEAPPLPISEAKKHQLDDLLLQYRANRITPEEYQKQRAAILAQP